MPAIARPLWAVLVSALSVSPQISWLSATGKLVGEDAVAHLANVLDRQRASGCRFVWLDSHRCQSSIAPASMCWLRRITASGPRAERWSSPALAPGTPEPAGRPGVIDVALAVTAVHFAATVLHYGSDFDHIAADPQLDGTWVVPRGSVD